MPYPLNLFVIKRLFYIITRKLQQQRFCSSILKINCCFLVLAIAFHFHYFSHSKTLMLNGHSLRQDVEGQRAKLAKLMLATQRQQMKKLADNACQIVCTRGFCL